MSWQRLKILTLEYKIRPGYRYSFIKLTVAPILSAVNLCIYCLDCFLV